MPVYKDTKRGTWFVSYSFKELPSNKFKKKTKRGFKTKRDAERWEHQSICDSQYDTNQNGNEKASLNTRPNKTFKELASEWEDSQNASTESRRHHNECFKYRLDETFDRQLEDISKTDLIKWRIKLSNNDIYATKTKNDTLTFVRSVYLFAHRVYDYPDYSYVLTNIKKTNEEIMKEMAIWTPEEFNRFISCVDDDIYRTFYKFLFWTGCRRGEGIALQKKDLYDGKCFIRFSQRTQKVGLKPTKTKQTRWIRFDQSLNEEMQKIAQMSDGPYVFFGEKGLSTTCIDTHFKDAIKASGVKQIRIHDLRHSHASWLINSGANIVAVSKRLGHSTIEQTLKTYTHLIPDISEELISIIDDYKITKS